jgi:hypothetical protein
MRIRRVLLDVVLFALVVTLVLIAYFQPGRPKPVPVPALTSLNAEEIRRIQIVYPGGQTITLIQEEDGKKSGTEWLVQEPYQMPANQFPAETLASLAQATSTAQYPAQQMNLHELKLDKPLLTVHFNAVEVHLGDTEPLSGRRYALVGDTVHLISDSVSALLNAEPTAFVSHALLPADARPIAITLPPLKQGQGDEPAWGGVQLRFEDSRWSLDPADPGVSQDSINNLVDGWRYAHALEVKPLDKARKPIATVTVSLKGEAMPLRFDILSLTPELVLGRQDVGLQYHLAEPLAARLFTLTPAKDTDTSKNVEG